MAYNVRDEASALELAQQAADQAEAQVNMLQYQLSFLQNKFASDDRKVQAEVKALVSSAQHGFAQRQLRHIMAVSELRRVYDHQKEFSSNIVMEALDADAGKGGNKYNNNNNNNNNNSNSNNNSSRKFGITSDTARLDAVFEGATTTNFDVQPKHNLPEKLTWSSNMIAGVSSKGFTTM